MKNDLTTLARQSEMKLRERREQIQPFILSFSFSVVVLNVTARQFRLHGFASGV